VTVLAPESRSTWPKSVYNSHMKVVALATLALVALTVVSACGASHRRVVVLVPGGVVTSNAATKTLTYRWAKPFPLYVRIRGPAEAVVAQAHSLRAHFERTHPTLVRNAPGHAICTFPGLQGSVTVRLYGGRSLVSARCKRIAKALGE
jgi:hypothetical protein